jgi:hypothetical protein
MEELKGPCKAKENLKVTRTNSYLQINHTFDIMKAYENQT